ncbi:DUF4402 domain-containing protein, partial [bacterium]|nr:DUF4402 domain-containing protein [bacterium]
MKRDWHHSFSIGRKLLLMAGIMLLCGSVKVLMAQPLPPRPVVITVNHSQPLAFGAFTPGVSGGTITVSPDGGTRTSTGTVIPLNMGLVYT